MGVTLRIVLENRCLYAGRLNLKCYLSRKTKVRLYHQLISRVVPMFLYGAESGSPKNSNVEILAVSDRNVINYGYLCKAISYYSAKKFLVNYQPNKGPSIGLPNSRTVQIECDQSLEGG